MNQPDWFSRVRVLLTEITSLISFLMFLAWAIWQEYHHLFGVSR
jgi:hypothetical protein